MKKIDSRELSGIVHSKIKELSAGPGTTPVTMAGFPGYPGPAESFFFF